MGFALKRARQQLSKQLGAGRQLLAAACSLQKSFRISPEAFDNRFRVKKSAAAAQQAAGSSQAASGSCLRAELWRVWESKTERFSRGVHKKENL